MLHATPQAYYSALLVNTASLKLATIEAIVPLLRAPHVHARAMALVSACCLYRPVASFFSNSYSPFLVTRTLLFLVTRTLLF